jgi:hypothetical protein
VAGITDYAVHSQPISEVPPVGLLRGCLELVETTGCSLKHEPREHAWLIFWRHLWFEAPVMGSCLVNHNVVCFDQEQISDRGPICCLVDVPSEILGRIGIVRLLCDKSNGN